MHAWCSRPVRCLTPHWYEKGFSSIAFKCSVALPFNTFSYTAIFHSFWLLWLSFESDCPESTNSFSKLSPWMTALKSSALFCIFKPRYLLLWFILQLLQVTPLVPLFLSLGAFIYLHGFSYYRIPKNLLLHTLQKITCALNSPLPGHLATSLGSAMIFSPFYSLFPNMCPSDTFILHCSHC